MSENELPEKIDSIIKKSGRVSPDTERDIVNDILETDAPIILATEQRLNTNEDELDSPDLFKVIGVNDV